MALLTASAFSRWPTMAPDARRLEAQAPAILPLVALQLARVLASPGPGIRGLAMKAMPFVISCAQGIKAVGCKPPCLISEAPFSFCDDLRR